MILNEKQLKSISKFLSFILRHHPEQIGITLDKDGWVDIDTLLTQVNHPERGFTGNPLTYEILMEVVENNDKKRFTVSEDGKRIRAAQGHSTAQVQVEHKVATPPQILYHGTAERSVPSILEQGLHILPRAILFIYLPMPQQPLKSAPATASRLDWPSTLSPCLRQGINFIWRTTAYG